MKKGLYIILCIIIFVIGIYIGENLKVYLDNDQLSQPTYEISDEDFLGTKKYHTVKLGEFGCKDVKNNTVYLLANNLIADAYNSPDNYQKYNDIISYNDFINLIPYIAGNGENVKPITDNTGDFYIYEICEFKYTNEKAIISYSFDYYQYDNSDCRNTKRLTSDSIDNPVRIYFIFNGEKWIVDHVFDPI